MSRMADDVGAMIRELAESMKAERAERELAEPALRQDKAANLRLAGRIEQELLDKYFAMPAPKLSAKALGMTVEKLRPLRPGSKWGLPE